MSEQDNVKAGAVAAGARKGRGRKRLLIGAGVLAAAAGVVVALAPTVASSMAAGRIEGAVNPGIKGRLKVAKASIGWFKPLEAGPVEVFDEKGDLAARLTLAAPVTVWRVLSGRWWSAERIEVGTVEASGLLDLKQYNDGTTNLQRAFEPRTAKAGGGGGGVKSAPSKAPAKSGGSTPGVSASLKLTQFDATVRNESDGFKDVLGVKGLSGRVDVDSGSAGLKAVVDIAGTALAPGKGASGSPMTVKMDADVKPVAGKGMEAIERAKVKVDVKNAPIAVADAVAALGGALVEGVGDTADISADVDGNLTAMAGSVKVTSAGLTTDASFAVKDGVLMGEGEKPLAVNMKSAAFLERLPQTREGVASARQHVRLTQAPSVEVAIEKLSVPMPKPGASMAEVDWRKASVGLRVKASALSGEVAMAGEGAPGTEGRAVNWRPFEVEPIELVVAIDDLGKPVRVETGTRARLDGKAAGDVRIALEAEGLLDANGRLRAMQGGAGFANKAEARVDVKDVSTALLQPLAAGLGLPLELSADVGPTIDVGVLAKADVAGVGGGDGAGGGGLAAVPPSDVTATVRSSNLNADVEARLENGVLTTKGKGIRLTVASSAGLAQRIIASGATADAPAAVAVGGRGAVELAVSDLSAPLGDGGVEKLLSAGRGAATVTVTDLSVTPDLGGKRTPVEVGRFAARATLTPGSAPRVTLDSALSHEGSPFVVDGDIALAGLVKGLPKSAGIGAIPEINPTGTVALKNLPRSALGIVAAFNDRFGERGAGAAADEMSRAIASAVRGAIGSSVTTTVRMMPAGADKGGGQFANLKMEMEGKGATADVWARVTGAEAELTSAVIALGLNPAAVDPVLAALNKPGADGSVTPPMRVGAPSKLYVEVKQPVKVPLAGASPDWARAGDAKVQITLEGDALVEGVVLEDARSTGGALRTATVALRGLKGEVVAPLSGLDAKLADTKRATVKLGADALDRTAGEKKIATLSVDASATMSGGKPEGEVTLSGMSTAHAEGLIGKTGLLTGALGNTAEVKLKARPLGAGGLPGAVGEVTAVEVGLTSPRVSGADLHLAMDDEKVFTTKASTITWTPDAAFINKYLLGGQEEPARPTPGAPGATGRPRRGAGEAAPKEQAPPLSLREAQPITVQIEKLKVAKTVDEPGKAPAGPLKPGVFDLGLSLSAPSMSVLTAAGEGGAPAVMTIEGLRMEARSVAGATPGAVEADLRIGKVSGAGADSAKASSAKVQIGNLADAAGHVVTERAVVNADVDVAAFPTPIVDQLAQQQGLLTELLGPTVSLKATARNVSKGAGTASGSVEATADSPRATAKLKGDMREGAFVQSGPVDVQLKEIRPQLVDALAGGLPLIESLEKTKEDAPAEVKTEGLTVPLDKDMRKLNGRVTVSPGVARFTTGNVFGKILTGLGGREGGAIGRRIEPFVVNIDKGVATYERFKLPFGEFTLETRGKVDLVQRQIDVVTYAPFFALSEEAVGRIRVGIPGGVEVIDRATMVPITTKGSMDNPKTELDIGLFIKELGDRILQTPGDLLKQPGKILENILGPRNQPGTTPVAPGTSPSTTPPTAPPSTPPTNTPPATPPAANPPTPGTPKPPAPKQTDPKPADPKPKPPSANPPAPPATNPPATEAPKDKPKPRKKKEQDKPEEAPK